MLEQTWIYKNSVNCLMFGASVKLDLENSLLKTACKLGPGGFSRCSEQSAFGLVTAVSSREGDLTGPDLSGNLDSASS